ncbi:MAG TPA: hypothetical protein DCE42_28015 [Myxococcales bacterium]|nr:hypothetical protein [Myxococcales bacterium]
MVYLFVILIAILLRNVCQHMRAIIASKWVFLKELPHFFRGVNVPCRDSEAGNWEAAGPCVPPIFCGT